MKAVRAWQGVRMRKTAAAAEPDQPERPITLPASWDAAASAALAELAPGIGPVSLADAAERWIGPIAALAERRGFGPISETLHTMLRARQAAPSPGIWANRPEAEPAFLFNLANFHDATTGFDTEAFTTAIDAAVIALTLAAPAATTIRLAPTDTAGLLALLGLDYAGTAAQNLTACLAALLRARADTASARMAEIFGTPSAPRSPLPAPPATCLIPGLAAAAAEAIGQSTRAPHHAATTAILPPGPADGLLGVETGGIAPAFSPLAAHGRLTRTARAALAARGLTPEAALADLLAGIDPLPTATASAHAAMRAAVAPYIQALPTLRAASTLAAPTTTHAKSQRRDLPTRRTGNAQRATVAGHTVFLRTGEYMDGTLGEVSLLAPKESPAVRALLDCVGHAIGIGLQHGVPLADYVDAFANTQFAPHGHVEGDPAVSRATSILDYAVRHLAAIYLNRHLEEPEDADPTEPPLLPLDLPQEPAPRLRLVKR